MTYEYELNQTCKKKYGFTHLLANGWFGYYEDELNKKFDDNKKCYIKKSLTDIEIDEIVNGATARREYN